MNRKEQKLLDQIVKSLSDDNIEDVAEFPQIIESLYTDVGAIPPPLDVIKDALEKEISRREKKLIVKEVFQLFKNRKKADD